MTDFSSFTSLAYPHIDIDQHGVPRIAGTRTKVVEVVLDRLPHHWDADEIQRQHPHLSLSQIYAALGYYHDHREELDRDIAARLRKVDEIATVQSESDIMALAGISNKDPEEFTSYAVSRRTILRLAKYGLVRESVRAPFRWNLVAKGDP